MGEEASIEYCSNLATESADPVVASSYIGSISEPGERPQADGLEAEAEEGSDPIALSYADQRRCPGNLNLISVFGDRTPRNDSIGCDSKFCGLQIVGTGARMTDVTIDNKFQKLNAIRADRAGGIVIKNLTAQQAEFNAIYVMETDGFVVDHVTTRGNDEYGILSFASDHGVIQHTNNYYNGDSGIYPGSASDLNGDNTDFDVERYAIEIRHNRSHDNTLGYSGTAGNSVYAHHNRFYDNATGIATDSLVPRPPRSPAGPCPLEPQPDLLQQQQLLHRVRRHRRLRRADQEARLHRRHRLPGDPDPGRHGGPDRRRQLQLHRPQLDLRQLAVRHHAVLGAGTAA